ncbi:MAG: FG-GAP-like repeat-containing protein [Phycisphaeraceae bacterium]
MSSAAAESAWFVDVTESAGLTHTHLVDPPPPWEVIRSPESAGAAVGDYDGDGLLDLFFTRLDDTDILYANEGDGTFRDVTAEAFGGEMPDAGTNGAMFADLNNDGHLDLFVNGGEAARHYLFVNRGDGTFVERGAQRGAGRAPEAHPMRGQSVTAGDFTGDGYLDLYVADWSIREPGDPPRNRLLANRGAAMPGHFEDVTVAAGLDQTHNQYGFAGRFADLDRDGHADLVVTNDFGHSALYWNQGDGTFVDGAAQAGTGTGTNEMGLTVADYDNDGWLDVFATSIGSEGVDSPTLGGNRLLRNEIHRDIPGIYFSHQTDTAGVRWGDWGWGASFIDYNNDGLRDLVMVNGFPQEPYVTTPMRFWENQGDGTFVEKGAQLGLTDDGDGRGVIVADFMGDGWLDILVVNHKGQPVLYRNQGGDNDWLRIDTVGTRSNRQGIGAWITVVPDLDNSELFYVHEVNLGSNYLTHNETTAHFGLGDLDGLVDYVHIRWPSGVEQELFNVSPNQVLTVHELPEPGTVAMLVAGLGLLMRRRVCRRHVFLHFRV